VSVSVMRSALVLLPG